MRPNFFELLKHQVNRTTIGVCCILVLLGAIISSISLGLNIPVDLYLTQTENPWSPISSETYPEQGVNAIDFVDSSHGWLAGANGMIMATTDGGKSWQAQISGINGNFQDIDFFDGNVGVAITLNDYIIITQNGGQTWVTLERVTNPDTSKSVTLWDVVTFDVASAVVLGITGDFYKVDIVNQNWTFISQIPLSPHYLVMLNNSHGWAVGGFSTIIRTMDGWVTYEVQDAGISRNFYGIFFWDASTGWIVGSDNTILMTVDGGQHWQVQYSYRPFFADFGTVALLDIFFITKLKGWAVGSYGIHCTTNGGISWIRLPDTSGPDRITFVNETHGWAIQPLKERSYTTSVGGVVEVDVDLLNLETTLFIFGSIACLILLVIILTIVRQVKALNSGVILTRSSDQVCQKCGNMLLLHAKFCDACGEPTPPNCI